MIIVSGCLILTAVNLIVLIRMAYKTEISIVTFDIGFHEVCARTGWRAYALHNQISWMDSLPNFFTHDAPLRALLARKSSAITLFKDFETFFVFLLNSLNDHYFGQYLVRLVVFLGDDERIFLLLFETIISQACKYVLRPPKRLTFQIVLFLANQPQFSHVCLSSLVTTDPH